MNTFLALLATALPYWILDGLWLGVIAKSFLQKQLGHLMGDIIWWPALLFYALYPAAMYMFVVSPAIAGNLSIGSVALRGALFGLVTYATYDLTNHATLKNWPATVTGVDLLWGTFVVAISATIAVIAIRATLS